jgi:hypothetical protein
MADVPTGCEVVAIGVLPRPFLELIVRGQLYLVGVREGLEQIRQSLH